MKIYGIGGLGADQRVFKYLKLNGTFIFLDWLIPDSNECIQDYAERFSSEIDQKDDFVLLGVSFGGLIAVEMCKFVKPALVILVSSAEVRSELHPVAVLMGNLGFMSSVPSVFMKPPTFIIKELFGAKNKKLLRDILHDTDSNFVKWALIELMRWKNQCFLETKVLKIIGSKDLLFPPSRAINSISLPGGGHFMVVDRADEISAIINEELERSYSVLSP